MNSESIACVACGSAILRQTAEKYAGLCAPCANGTRSEVDAGKRRREATHAWKSIQEQVPLRTIKRLWSLPDPANMLAPREVTFTPDGRSVFVSSSHGRPYSAATFKRLESVSGRVEAVAKPRDGVRCCEISDDSERVFAATSKRVLEFDARTLAERSSHRRGVPLYPNSLRQLGLSLAVGAANEVVFLDGENASPVRRRTKDLVALDHDFQRIGLFAFSGSEGMVRHFEKASARPKIVLEADPFLDAYVLHSAQEFHLVSDRNELVRCKVDGDGYRVDTLFLPFRFRWMTFSKDGTYLYVSDYSELARFKLGVGDLTCVDRFQVDETSEIIAVNPEQGVAIATKPADDGIEISGHSLETE